MLRYMEESKKMMYLDERSRIIAAGRRLAESGLIARTWGNISCRADSDHFLITPSGRLYSSLAPEDIVLVNTKDLSSSGTLRPSSEKGIHAAAYRLRPDVHFVIHTHQTEASVVSSAGRSIDVNSLGGRDLIGRSIPIAEYALPGSDELCWKVTHVIENSGSRAIIMANHGALCLGNDAEDAFRIAGEMETVCRQYIFDCYFNKTGIRTDDFSDIRAWYLKRARVRADLMNGTDVSCGRQEFERPSDTTGYGGNIFAARPDILYVINSKEDDIMTVSKTGKTLKPYLDDLAQIAGPNVRCVPVESRTLCRFAISGRLFGSGQLDDYAVLSALGDRNAVFVQGEGAFCCGSSKSDAEAVEMVLKKGCRAAIAAVLFEKARPIGPSEAQLMRRIYLTDYSKQAGDTTGRG